MVKSIELKSSDYGKEIGELIELEYRLLENRNDDFEDDFQGIRYGVEINKKINNQSIEKTVVRDYTSSKVEANHLLDLLVQGTVTPQSLYEILDDILGI